MLSKELKLTGKEIKLFKNKLRKNASKKMESIIRKIARKLERKSLNEKHRKA